MSDVKITASDQELQAVVLFAAEAHGNQFRKHSHLPYITHPFQVLSLVAEWNVCNPESVKAGTPVYDLITWKSALCHDIREERPDITQKMLEAKIGVPAAAVVEELSFFPDPRSNVSVPDQKAAYMKTFMTKSLRALIVKCADRICNTIDFMTGAPDYAGKYWRKAEPLFEAMMSRGEQILEFGPDVLPRMKWSRDSLKRQLVR